LKLNLILLGNWEKVYAARHELANYFLRCEDFRLADYFYESSLEISFKIRMDGRRREAEALYYMGLVCVRYGMNQTVACTLIIRIFFYQFN